MEDPVIRLPKYARGLQLVRIGVFLMFAQLGIGLVMTTKLIAGSEDIFEWMKYSLWAGAGATGVMFLGALFAVPDFVRTKIPLRPVVTAAIALGLSLAMLLWPYLVLQHLMDVLEQIKRDPLSANIDDLIDTTDKLVQMDWLAVVKDIAYGIGIYSIVSSIRHTAEVNDHSGLRDTASYVGRILGVMTLSDVVFQISHRALGRVLPLLGIGVLLVGIGILVYWIYGHYKLQLFLKAAAQLVNEPHHLPTARVVSTSETAPAAAPAKPRASVPRMAAPPIAPVAAPAPAGPPVAMPTAAPSQPVIVAAELRAAPAPRADTAPGEAAEPKFLR